MQPDYYKIISNLREGVINQEEVKHLFKLLYNIAIEYFRRNKKGYVFNSGILPEDAAMETITPLFIAREGKQFEKLCSAFGKWRPAISNNKDTLFFLHQLVFIRGDHYLINIFKKNNPYISAFITELGIKIRNSGFEKQTYCSTVYIINGKKIVAGSNIIPAENFDLISDRLFSNNNFNLEKLFCEFVQNGYFPAIPYNLIIERIRRINNPESPAFIQEEPLTEKMSVEEAADAGLKATLKKLNESYANKNKLNSHETAAFENALRDIRFDLTDGGISGGHFEYLHKYLPDLNHNIFKSTYENIFEYLVKTLKENTIQTLNERN